MSLFYERLKKANEEIDRLRAEKAELRELEADRDDLLGQNVILRAEKAELREALKEALLFIADGPGNWSLAEIEERSRAILAKANETEIDADLPTAN